MSLQRSQCNRQSVINGSSAALLQLSVRPSVCISRSDTGRSGLLATNLGHVNRLTFIILIWQVRFRETARGVHFSSDMLKNILFWPRELMVGLHRPIYGCIRNDWHWLYHLWWLSESAIHKVKKRLYLGQLVELETDYDLKLNSNCCGFCDSESCRFLALNCWDDVIWHVYLSRKFSEIALTMNVRLSAAWRTCGSE